MAFATTPTLQGVPPEIRLEIYNRLLADAIASEERIVYYTEDDNGDCDISDHIEWKHVEEKCNSPDHRFHHLRKRCIFPSTVSAKRTVHMANIQSLLALAATCRQIRNETSPIVWQNAAPTIAAHGSKVCDTLEYLVLNSLSAETCGMVRALRLEIVGRADVLFKWNRVSRLIRARLPYLKHLSIHFGVVVRRFSRLSDECPRGDEIRHLVSLGSRVCVTFNPSPLAVGNQLWTCENSRAVEYCRRAAEHCSELWNKIREPILTRHHLRAENEKMHASGKHLEESLSLRALAME